MRINLQMKILFLEGLDFNATSHFKIEAKGFFL